MLDHYLLIIHIQKRNVSAVEVQKLLTSYGGHITTRLGLHDPDANGGIVIVQLSDDKKDKAQALKVELEKLESVDVRYIELGH